MATDLEELMAQNARKSQVQPGFFGGLYPEGVDLSVGSIMEGLDRPRQATQEVLGPFARGARKMIGPSDTLLGQAAFGVPGSVNVDLSKAPEAISETGGALREQLTGKTSEQESFQQATEDLPFHAQLALELGTDPISYVGLGIPAKLSGKAILLATKLGAPPHIASRVGNAMVYLDGIDKATAALPWQVTSGAFKAGLRAIGDIPLGPLGGVMKTTTETAGKEVPTTIGEWGRNRARQSWFKYFTRQVEDFTNAVGIKGLGRSLSSDIKRDADLGAIEHPLSIEHTQELFDRSRDDLLDAVAALPSDQKAWGMAVLSSTDSLVLRRWDQAQVEALEIWKRAMPAHNKPGRAVFTPEDWGKLEDAFTRAWKESKSVMLGATAALTSPPPALASLSLPARALRAVDQALVATDAANSAASVAIGGLPKGPGRSAQAAPILAARNAKLAAIYDGAKRALAGKLPPGIDPDSAAERLTGEWLAEGRAFHTGREVERKALLDPTGKQTGWQDIRVIKEGFPVISPYLSEQLQPIAQREWPNFRKQANSLARDKGVIAKSLKSAWEKTHGAKPMPADPLDPGVSPDKYYSDVINPILTGLGKKPAKDPVELLARLQDLHLGSPSEFRKVEAATLPWKDVEDFLSADPYEAVAGRVMREKAQAFEVGERPAIIEGLSFLTDLFKTGVLVSGSYLVTNLFGALLVNAIAGVGPSRTLKNLAVNMGKIVGGENFTTSEFRHASQLLGLPDAAPGVVAHAGIISEVTPVRSLAGQGLSAPERAGSLPLGIAGGLTGGLAGALDPWVDPENRTEAIAHGAVAGAGAGALFPVVAKYMMRLTRGVEGVVRQEAYLHGLIQSVAGRLDGLTTEVGKALLGSRSRTALDAAAPTGRKVVQVPRDLNPSQSIKDWDVFLKSRGGLLSPEDVGQFLRSKKLTQEESRLVEDYWRREVQAASVDGQALVSKVHVDYELLNNVEQFIKTAIPFSTWPVKMTPFFAKHILEHPYVLLALLKFNAMSEELRKEQGLTSRTKGAAPMPLGDALYSALLGRAVTTWQNPIRAFLPFADAARGIDRIFEELEPESGEAPNYLGAAQEALGVTGLSLNPMLDTPLRILAGGDDPARGYFRQAGPIQGLEALMGLNKGRGYNLNAAFTGLESKARQFIHGEEPTDLQQLAIYKRIDELALRETGRTIRSGDPIVAPYIAAKSMASGEIWDRASKQVGRERGLQSLLGFISPILNPQAILSKEEAEIRQAQADRREDPQIEAILVFRDAIKFASREGHAHDQAPPELWEKLNAFLNESRDWTDRSPTNRQDSEFIDRAIKVGTYGAMDRILDRLYPAPTDESTGYAGGSNTERGELDRLMAVWRNPAALVATSGGDADSQARAASLWEQYQSAGGPIKAHMLGTSSYGGMLRAMMNRRDEFAQSHPLLKAYLAYQDSKGWQGNPDDFFQTYNR